MTENFPGLSNLESRQIEIDVLTGLMDEASKKRDFVRLFELIGEGLIVLVNSVEESFEEMGKI